MGEPAWRRAGQAGVRPQRPGLVRAGRGLREGQVAHARMLPHNGPANAR